MMNNFLRNIFHPLTKMEMVMGIYIFCLFCSETMGFKLIPLFNLGDLALSTSVSIFVMPFIFSINDMVTEVYGYKKTLALSRLGLFIIVLIALYSLFFTALPAAPRFASMNDAYKSVFGFSLRISIASLTAFAVSQVTDIFIFKYIRQKLGEHKFWLRNNLSNIVSLLVDTIIVMVIARYNLANSLGDNVVYLIGLILPYWIFKCTMSALMTPLTYLGVKWLRKSESK